MGIIPLRKVRDMIAFYSITELRMGVSAYDIFTRTVL